MISFMVCSWTPTPCGRRVPDPETRVYGVLMDLSHNEIERLYAERSVREYRPEPVIT